MYDMEKPEVLSISFASAFTHKMAFRYPRPLRPDGKFGARKIQPLVEEDQPGLISHRGDPTALNTLIKMSLQWLLTTDVVFYFPAFFPRIVCISAKL